MSPVSAVASRRGLLFALSPEELVLERQVADMHTLDVATKRDPGNRRGTWTPEEVAAADRLDDAYDVDELAHDGRVGPVSLYVPDDHDGVMTWPIAPGIPSAPPAEARKRERAPNVERVPESRGVPPAPRVAVEGVGLVTLAERRDAKGAAS